MPAAMPTLETAQLILRGLSPDDAPHLEALFAGDWEAIKQTGRMPYPADEPAMRTWIRRQIGPGAYNFLIIRKSDGEVVGAAGFRGDGVAAELGYALGRLYWGRGYATEAVRALVDLAQGLGLELVDAYCFIDNPASVRVLEKADFEDRGTVLRRYPQRGGLYRVRHFRRTFEGAR